MALNPIGCDRGGSQDCTQRSICNCSSSPNCIRFVGGEEVGEALGEERGGVGEEEGIGRVDNGAVERFEGRNSALR